MYCIYYRSSSSSSTLNTMHHAPPPKRPRTSETNVQTVRFATFNTALSRSEAGVLFNELSTGSCIQARCIATIIQEVKPDVLLLQEIDLPNGGEDMEGSHQLLDLLINKYFCLGGKNPLPANHFQYKYPIQVNTGKTSPSLSPIGHSKKGHNAFGYGKHHGQYGMAILSKFPIIIEKIKTFQSEFFFNGKICFYFPSSYIHLCFGCLYHQIFIHTLLITVKSYIYKHTSYRIFMERYAKVSFFFFLLLTTLFCLSSTIKYLYIHVHY